MKLRFGLLMILSVFMYGCASPNMKLSMPTTVAPEVPSDKALVYFLRPSKMGFLINAAVYDGDKFVGFVPWGQKLPYLAEPGDHRFMVVSEAADFMDAELIAGKTYYARVVPRMGMWRARFSLAPVTKGEIMNGQASTWITNAKLIENKPEAYQWATENKSSVDKKRTEYVTKWLKKDKSKQPKLNAEDAK